MASRAFTSSLRSSIRTSLHFSRYAGRRSMSSAAHAPAKSDKPWIIGSALFFGPLIAYLLSPSARASSSHGSHDAHGKHEELNEATMTDDEGAKADVTSSLAAAEAEDVPSASSAEATVIVKPEPNADIVKDDEGTPTDVSESVAKSLESDSPRDAAKKEEQSS